MNNWISVKDRLPDHEGLFLCCERIYSGPTFGGFINGEFNTNIADDWADVTHWMPLPDPPKEET